MHRRPRLFLCGRFLALCGGFPACAADSRLFCAAVSRLCAAVSPGVFLSMGLYDVGCLRRFPLLSDSSGFLRMVRAVDPVCVKNSGKHPEKGCFPFDCRSEQGGWPDGRWSGWCFRLSGASVVPAAPARLALRGLPLAAVLLSAAPYFLPFTFHFSLSVNPCEMKVSIGSRPVRQ